MLFVHFLALEFSVTHDTHHLYCLVPIYAEWLLLFKAFLLGAIRLKLLKWVINLFDYAAYQSFRVKQPF